MSTQNFYKDLSLLHDIQQITDESNYTIIPSDWFIIITDIKGSTKAIAKGKYKDVNMIGACSIAAALNVSDGIDIPFIFGGDGATMLIPPILLAPIQQAMQATKDLAQNAFKFELRVGIVPIEQIQMEGKEIKICKYQISPNYNQAMFLGGGLSYAEKLIKNEETSPEFTLLDDGIATLGDFTGLECRWKDIASPRGETISLLVMANNQSSSERKEIYKKVLQKINEIYGNESQRHPIYSSNLQVALNPEDLQLETEIRNQGKGFWTKLIYRYKLWVQNIFLTISSKLGIFKNIFDIEKYKNIVVESTDHLKFDDTLRMVIAGNESHRLDLEKYLLHQYRNKNLVYGIHASDRALMTCLVFERYGKQVHFIDGADGGYTSAAKQFKKRLKRLSRSV